MPPTAYLAPSGAAIRVAISDSADAFFIKQIPGRTYISGYGRGNGIEAASAKAVWEIPASDDALSQLQMLLPSIEVEEEVERRLQSRRNDQRRIALARDGSYDVWPQQHIEATPYDHQRKACSVADAVLRSHHGYGIWHEVGCGKTLTVLSILANLQTQERVRHALVVCPASVISVWEREIAQFYRLPVEIIPLTGSVKMRCEKIRLAKPGKHLRIYIVNYEVLWRKEMLSALLNLAPDVMVADEAHKLKNAGSEQSKAARKIGLQSIKIAATGTPVANNLTDWYGIYRWLDSSVFGSSFTAFRDRYFYTDVINHTIRVVREPIPHRLDELNDKAHSVAHACSKAEALDLPPEVDVELFCDLSPVAARMYREMKQESITMLAGADDNALVGQNVLTKMLRLAQITGGFVKDHDGNLLTVSDAKLKLFKETLDDLLEQQEKLVVFARFTPEINALCEIVKKKEHLVGKIDGSVSIPDRKHAIECFQDSDEPRVMVVQTRAGGVGITLHRAHTAVFYSLDWSLSDWIQARGRVHRIGTQADRVTYVNLLATDTLDQKMLTALKLKRDAADASVHGWTAKELRGLLT